MKFHHGHSLGAGVAGGILLSSHSWLLVVLGLAAGWAARDLYTVLRWTAQAVADKYGKKAARPKPLAKTARPFADRIPY